MGTCITKINTCEGNIDLSGVNFTRKNDNSKINQNNIVDFDNEILDNLAKEYFNHLCKNSKMGNNNLIKESSNQTQQELKNIIKKRIMRKIILIQNILRIFFFTKKINTKSNSIKEKQENKLSDEMKTSIIYSMKKNPDRNKINKDVQTKDLRKLSNKTKNSELDLENFFMDINRFSNFSNLINNEYKEKIIIKKQNSIQIEKYFNRAIHLSQNIKNKIPSELEKKDSSENFYLENNLFKVNSENFSKKADFEESKKKYSSLINFSNSKKKINFFETNKRKIYKMNTISTSDSINFLNKFSSKDGSTGNESNKNSNSNSIIIFKKARKKNSILESLGKNEYEKLFNSKEKGKIIFENGNYYIGGLENDKANFFGIFYNKNNDIFKGLWKDEKAEGFGSYKSPEYSLMGTWKGNELEGFGINFIKKNKLYFEGDFSKGRKNGLGILVINEGKYEGEFKNDKMHGIGSFYFKDERVFHGEWNENKMHGNGLMIWKDNKKYEGGFKNNKKSGYGIFHADNKVYFGNWENSKLEGDVYVYEKGNFNRYFYEEGKKIKKIKIDNMDLCIYLKNLVEIK